MNILTTVPGEKVKARYVALKIYSDFSSGYSGFSLLLSELIVQIDLLPNLQSDPTKMKKGLNRVDTEL